MPPPEGVPLAAFRYLEQAESDLAYARLGSGQEGIRPELVCFHAQQAAEKALKAVLLAQPVKPPFIHDIGVLLGRLEEQQVAVPEELQDAAPLTIYAVRFRYPDDDHGVEQQDVVEAIRVAASVVAWANDQVKASERHSDAQDHPEVAEQDRAAAAQRAATRIEEGYELGGPPYAPRSELHQRGGDAERHP